MQIRGTIQPSCRGSAIDLHRRPAAEALPALDGDLDVARLDLQGIAASTEPLGRHQRRAAAQERVLHRLAAAQMVGDRRLVQDHWLLRRMVDLGLSEPPMSILGLGARHAVDWSRVPRKGAFDPRRRTTQHGS